MSSERREVEGRRRMPFLRADAAAARSVRAEREECKQERTRTHLTFIRAGHLTFRRSEWTVPYRTFAG